MGAQEWPQVSYTTGNGSRGTGQLSLDLAWGKTCPEER